MYRELQVKLDVADVRTLEDLIIDTIYKVLITAKMNQKEQILQRQSLQAATRLQSSQLIDQLSVFMQICDEQIN